MNIVLVFNGLGNQMSQYAFYLAKKNANKNTIFIYYPAKNDNKHNGYELERIFDLKLKKDAKHLIKYIIYSIYANRNNSSYYGWICRKVLKVLKICLIYEKSYSFDSTYLNISSNDDIFFWGGWHNENYFEHIKNDVKKHFIFPENKIDKKSFILKNEITEKNSVSIHVRRGDYLSNNIKSLYGGICDLDYYKRAINYMIQNIENPFFYIFSDDKQWVLDNFKIENSKIVDNNFGLNSWKDMYLMSHCKHNINANSTFSWWAAWLNNYDKKIVIVPKKFNNNDEATIYPETWIKL